MAKPPSPEEETEAREREAAWATWLEKFIEPFDEAHKKEWKRIVGQ
jgi:hypothetical protein